MTTGQEQLPVPRCVLDSPPHLSPAEGSHVRGAALPLGRAARAQGDERAERKAERCVGACVAGRQLDLI